MALIDETVVEEWLNRQGYFTIRSLKQYPNELDLLAFRPRDNDALHIEVNISRDKPRGWIGKKDLAGNPLPEGKRTPEQIEQGIKNYGSVGFLVKSVRNGL